MKELPWVELARKHIGLREIVGPKHNPTILYWLAQLKAWWNDDETPWCGVFVAAMLKQANRYVVKHWYRALDWNNGGKRLDRAAYGCIVTFTRSGGGHVGFVVGKDKQGRLMVLGGNQSNSVSIAPFDVSRVSAYIWPADENGNHLSPLPERYNLPILDSKGQPSSTNEA